MHWGDFQDTAERLAQGQRRGTGVRPLLALGSISSRSAGSGDNPELHVLGEMDRDPQGKATTLDRFGFVLQGLPELVDFVDHAAAFRIVCRPIRIVPGFIEGTST